MFHFQQLKYGLQCPQGDAKKHVCVFEFLALHLALHERDFWFCYEKTVAVNPTDTGEHLEEEAELHNLMSAEGPED